MAARQLKKIVTLSLLFVLTIAISNSIAEDSPPLSSYGYDDDLTISTGPKDDTVDDYDDDTTAYVIDDDEEQDGAEVDTSSESKAPIEKRHLGALARQGDTAARRIHTPYGQEPYTYNDDDVWADDKETRAMAEKRNIGSLAKGGFHKLRYSAPRPSSFSRTTSTSTTPKRFYDEEDDLGLMPYVGDGRDNEEQYFASKRNIASLARQGTMTHLRMQRRPVPWISDEDYEYNDRMRPHDGYKRNIQTLARIAPPGFGFRSWLRGRLHPQSSPENKRRLVHGRFGSSFTGGRRYSLFGRGQLGVTDRFRGVRSTRDMNNIVQGSPSFRSGIIGGFRAPMAFVSRHVWKRAIGDRLLRHRMSSSSNEPRMSSSTATDSPLEGHDNIKLTT